MRRRPLTTVHDQRQLRCERIRLPLYSGAWTRVELREWAFALRAEVAGADPPRREAEFALEEGELLALRLPREAQVLLRRANDYFSMMGDQDNAFCAAVLQVRAAFHADEFSVARSLLADEVRERYDALRDRPSLPAWDAPAEPGMWHGDLKPWLERLATYRAWANGDLEPGPAGWIETQPPGLITVRPRPALPSAGPRARPWHWVAFLAVIVAAILLLGGDGVVLAVGVAVLFVAAGVSLLPERGTCRVTSETPPEDSIVSIGLELRRPGLRILHRAYRQTGATDDDDPTGPVTRALSSRRRFRTALVIDEHLTDRPWEARLAANTDPERWPDLYRVTPGGDPGVLPVDRGGAPVGVIGPERWLLLSENAWAAAGAAAIESATDPRSMGLPPVWLLAHVLGAPALVDGRWRLRLDAARLASAVEGAFEEASSASEALMAARDLVWAQPRAVVIQGVPGPVDSRAAEGLRGFGAAVAAVTDSPVLVIPTLPPDVAADVLAAAGMHLIAGDRLKTGQVLDAARDARRAILAGLSGARVPTELVRVTRTALDVCLFARFRR